MISRNQCQKAYDLTDWVNFMAFSCRYFYLILSLYFAISSMSCSLSPEGASAKATVTNPAQNSTIADTSQSDVSNKENLEALCLARGTEAEKVLIGIVIENHRCTRDEDCVKVSMHTSCYAGCSATINKSGAEIFDQARNEINTQCSDYSEQCGNLIIPPCVAPRPNACIDSICQ